MSCESEPTEPRYLTKAQFREVARMLRPDITTAEFNRMWAVSRLRAQCKAEIEVVDGARA